MGHAMTAHSSNCCIAIFSNISRAKAWWGDKILNVFGTQILHFWGTFRDQYPFQISLFTLDCEFSTVHIFPKIRILYGAPLILFNLEK